MIRKEETLEESKKKTFLKWRKVKRIRLSSGSKENEKSKEREKESVKKIKKKKERYKEIITGRSKGRWWRRRWIGRGQFEDRMTDFEVVHRLSRQCQRKRSFRVIIITNGMRVYLCSERILSIWMNGKQRKLIDDKSRLLNPYQMWWDAIILTTKENESAKENQVHALMTTRQRTPLLGW